MPVTEIKEKVDYKGQPILDTDGKFDGYIKALKKQVDEVEADPSKYKPMGTISVMPQKDKLKYIRYCFSLVQKFLNLSPAKIKRLWLYMNLRVQGASVKQIARMAKVPLKRVQEQEKEFTGLIQQAITIAQTKGVPLVGKDIPKEKRKIII